MARMQLACLWIHFEATAQRLQLLDPAGRHFEPHALRKCHAFGRVNVWIPYVDSVRPIPEWPVPDHGSRGLTRSQQFQ